MNVAFVTYPSPPVSVQQQLSFTPSIVSGSFTGSLGEFFAVSAGLYPAIIKSDKQAIHALMEVKRLMTVLLSGCECLGLG